MLLEVVGASQDHQQEVVVEVEVGDHHHLPTADTDYISVLGLQLEQTSLASVE